MNKKTLVIGASVNPERYAYKAIVSLIEAKHEVCAIGNKTGEVFGVSIKKEQILFEDIDTITLYLNPNNQKAYYDYILQLRPKRVIFNPGTENAELKKLLTVNGIAYEEACTLVLLATNQY